MSGRNLSLKAFGANNLPAGNDWISEQTLAELSCEGGCFGAAMRQELEERRAALLTTKEEADGKS